jgi:hypothetical protein
MGKSGKGRLWWWVVVVALLAALLGYFLRAELGHHAPETPLVAEKSSEEKELSKPPSELSGQQKEEEAPQVPSLAEEIPSQPAAEEDQCAQAEKDMAGFFHYLDQKKYVRDLDPRMDTHARFKEIFGQLEARPPVPSGEGVAPKLIVENVYYFFRTLDRTDLKLLREVMRHEQDSMENVLEVFYRWAMSGGSCPDTKDVRPSLHVLYRFAGFFMNTIGGRAYLSRRPQGVRLLISYYSVLILHQADLKGQNTYGIDVSSLIPPVLHEISHYPEFEFQKEYLRRINDIQSDYLQKR